MKTIFLMAAMFGFAFGLFAQGTNNLVPLKISAADATNYYDREMTVTGKVAQVTIRPTVTFLNLDEKFPISPLAVVIIHGHSSYYGDANALKGKSIEIRGVIKKYKDKPEIVLDSTNQLTVLDFTNSMGSISFPAISSPTNAPQVETSTNSFPEIM
jgi:DNA/RNA endonuclease YhcR with UshA esterase domain